MSIELQRITYDIDIACRELELQESKLNKLQFEKSVLEQNDVEIHDVSTDLQHEENLLTRSEYRQQEENNPFSISLNDNFEDDDLVNHIDTTINDEMVTTSLNNLLDIDLQEHSTTQPINLDLTNPNLSKVDNAEQCEQNEDLLELLANIKTQFAD